MLDQQTLLRLARDYAARKASERPSLRSALLVGSVARAEPPLGDAVDLDVVLVDDAPPEVRTELVRLSDFVLVDTVYVTPADYADRKALRVHHFNAPMLNDALPLHDPRHYFDLVQAAIRAPYNRSDHIYARARSACTAAARSFENLLPFTEDKVPETVSFDQLSHFHETLYLAGLAAILLTGQPEAAGPRKFMARFEAAARKLGNPELYSTFLNALGGTEMPPATVEALVNDWLILYRAANQRGAAAPFIHPLKRGYYERGLRALIAEGHVINTLWLLEHSMAACVNGLDPLPEAWLNFQRLMGKENGQQFAGQGFRGAGQLLALVDETLVAWARQEQIEW
jgi:hypothetical protein